MRWATTKPTAPGSYLLDTNPIRFKPESYTDARRPVASTDRYEAVRAVADSIPMSRTDARRSYLTELLDLQHHTGRRISAICQLTYADLRLSDRPHGSILWPARTDKMNRSRKAPLNPQARAAIDRVLRDRPGLGAAPLFPHQGPSPIGRVRAVRRLCGCVRRRSRRGWTHKTGRHGTRIGAAGQPAESTFRSRTLPQPGAGKTSSICSGHINSPTTRRCSALYATKANCARLSWGGPCTPGWYTFGTHCQRTGVRVGGWEKDRCPGKDFTLGQLHGCGWS
jgi:hypothetical protein